MNDLELQAVIRGEPTAVRNFIREFVPMFQAVIRKRVFGPWLEAEEDLVQEILTGLFANSARALRAWDPNKGRTLKNFLWVFAEQRIIDWMRMKRHAREEPTETNALLRKADAESALPQSEAPDWLEPLMARFRAECSAEDQRIVELSYLEERSVREIATLLNLSEDAVYQRRHRIKLRLLQMKSEMSKSGGSGA